MFLLSFWSDWGLLALRAALGAIFIVHGWPKIKDLAKNGKNFDAMGFHPGNFWGTIAALLEFFGGILMVLGLYTWAFSALFAIEFLVITIWKISKKIKFAGGWEFDLIILAAVVLLFAAGAGALSLDRYFWFAGI